MKRLALAILALLLAAPCVAADGVGTFSNGAAVSLTTTFFVGAGTPTTTQTSSSNFWITPRALTSCKVAFVVFNSPGSARTWTVNLLTNGTAPTSSQTCASTVGTMVSTEIGTISGTAGNSVHGTASVTAVAGSCLQLQVVAAGGPADVQYIGAQLYCNESGGDGPSVLSAKSGASSDATHNLAIDQTNIYFIAPYAISAVAGNYQINTVPGAGGTWDIAISASSDALSAGAGANGCAQLTYATTATKCSVGAADKNCAWAIDAGIDVPQWGCFRFAVAANLLPAATTLSAASLIVSSDGAEPYEGGGAEFAGSDLATNNLAEFSMGADVTVQGSDMTADSQYWHNAPDQVLTTCDFGTSFVNLGGPAGKLWAIKANVSTAGLTANQRCSDLSYSLTTLCTATAGSHRGCTGSATLNVPARGCVQLRAVPPVGEITTGTGGQVWGGACSAATLTPTNTPTATPTVTPTVTNTPTVTPTSTPCLSTNQQCIPEGVPLCCPPAKCSFRSNTYKCGAQ